MPERKEIVTNPIQQNFEYAQAGKCEKLEPE